jgi:nitroimidazol reductase NimA-like FMN-containing flavoprotein (pyridoxamine 5'-phosphate oxidase superfamily)
MTPQDKETILRLLAQHRIMTVATVRPDGWPQATTIGYASEGLLLYFLCSKQSQKAANIVADNRISLVVDHDTSDPMGRKACPWRRGPTPLAIQPRRQGSSSLWSRSSRSIGL